MEPPFLVGPVFLVIVVLGTWENGRTMKHRLPLFLIPSILVCTAAPALVAQGDAEPLSCADRSITASAVRTTEDVQAFVQCAYELVQEVGFEEARRAFNEDERWKSGPIYIFVSEATPMSDQARLFVFPPARSREGSSSGLLIDAFGNDYYKEQHRIVSSFGAGWLDLPPGTSPLSKLDLGPFEVHSMV